MQSYQPFLIADFSTGLELGKEPWLLPKDAFTTMNDALIHRGVLEKRKGYAPFASTGQGLAITGIFHLKDAQGARIQLVADQSYLYESDGSGLTPVSHSQRGANPVWTGSASSFIHWANWQGRVFMTNNQPVLGETTAGDGTGLDGIQVYDGSVFEALRPDLSGSGDYVDQCALIMVHKERLILFSTLENGAMHLQRARWCKPGDPEDWTNDGFVDAPTGEMIRGAAYIRDEIAVWFEQSVWLLRYTGDADLPFRWEKVSSVDGCDAPFSTASFQDKSLALGKAGPVLTDGLDACRVDEKIPNLALGFDQDHMDVCFGMVLEDQSQYWLLFPFAGSESADRVLVLNYDNWTWSIYNLAFNCLGYHTLDQSIIWLASPPNPVKDMSGVSWSACSEKWVSNAAQAGYPLVLAGDREGRVFQVNHTTSDGDGAAIGFEVVSGRWNPYREQGVKARLGRVDFLLETGSNQTLNVDFFKDASQTAYLTRQLSFDREGEKAWVRLYSGATGSFHRIRLYQNAAGQNIRIHAITPWFKPAGRVVS